MKTVTNKFAKNGEVSLPSRNSLGCGTKVKGNIESDGDFRIDGTLIGIIKTKGKVVIGSTGVLEGEVFCQNADIEGKVKAKLEVLELLTLKAESRLEGEVITGKIAIEPGAKFSGSCKMGGDKETPKTPLMNEKKQNGS
jgi:cytoskeletal protein CcmA (bactofilin family)